LLVWIATSTLIRCNSPNDCGIDGRCWDCIRHVCVADNAGATCNDHNSQTYRDLCQSDGSCVGSPISCVQCNNDDTCEDMIKYIKRIKGNLTQWVMPWQTIDCLVPTCQINPVYGVKCCVPVVDVGARCDDGKPHTYDTVCENDGSCGAKVNPCATNRACTIDANCSWLPLPSTAQCLQRKCDGQVCYIGFTPAGASCGSYGGLCDGSGTCLECTTQNVALTCGSRGTLGQCSRWSCVNSVCMSVPAATNQACGFGGTCDGNGLCNDCTTLNAATVCPSVRGLLGECRTYTCPTGNCTSSLATTGASCRSGSGHCNSQGNCILSG
jgi:hypothetical protein